MNEKSDNTEDSAERDPEVSKPSDPALVINIYSWLTPIIGVVMLLLGLVGGYFLRPLITDKATSDQAVTTPQAQEPTVDPTTEAAADVQRQQLMNLIIEQTRHFRGDEQAAVTIIEFSDFQ